MRNARVPGRSFHERSATLTNKLRKRWLQEHLDRKRRADPLLSVICRTCE